MPYDEGSRAEFRLLSTDPRMDGWMDGHTTWFHKRAMELAKKCLKLCCLLSIGCFFLLWLLRLGADLESKRAWYNNRNLFHRSRCCNSWLIINFILHCSPVIVENLMTIRSDIFSTTVSKNIILGYWEIGNLGDLDRSWRSSTLEKIIDRRTDPMGRPLSDQVRRHSGAFEFIPFLLQ